jgi:hypothetical protein
MVSLLFIAGKPNSLVLPKEEVIAVATLARA